MADGQRKEFRLSAHHLTTFGPPGYLRYVENCIQARAWVLLGIKDEVKPPVYVYWDNRSEDLVVEYGT